MTEDSRCHALEVTLPKFFEKGFCKDIPYQFRKKNGEIIDVLLSAIAERDETGNLVRSLAVTIDVTDRNRAEAELRQSEQRFRQIFNHSNDAIVVIDPSEDLILDCNDKVCRMLQYDRQELLEIPLSRVHPHDMPQVIAFTNAVIENGHGWTDELTWLTKSNQILNAEISAATSHLAGKPCIIASIRNITDRKQAEKALQPTDLAKVDFSEYLKALVSHLSESYNLNDRRIRCELDLESIDLNIETAHPCGLIVNELVANALEHAFPNDNKGNIWLSLKQNSDNLIVLTIKDNGIGLPTNLYFRQTESLGMQLVCTLTEQLEGEIKIQNCNGTLFEIVFSELNYTSRF